jgi:hypothetical protein
MGKVKVALQMLAFIAFVLLFSLAGMVFVFGYSLSESLMLSLTVGLPIVVISLLLTIYLLRSEFDKDWMKVKSTDLVEVKGTPRKRGLIGVALILSSSLFYGYGYGIPSFLLQLLGIFIVTKWLGVLVPKQSKGGSGEIGIDTARASRNIFVRMWKIYYVGMMGAILIPMVIGLIENYLLAIQFHGEFKFALFLMMPAIIESIITVVVLSLLANSILKEHKRERSMEE